MNVFDRLFHRSQKEEPTPLFSDAEIHAREKMHEEWEQDYRRRAKRLYDLERRANWLSERLFAPVPDDKGEQRGR
jgi:hypothetical protein